MSCPFATDVEARAARAGGFDFDPDDEPGEAIPVDQFIEILDRWRDQVLTRSPAAATNYPSTRTWTVGTDSSPVPPDE